MNHVKPQNACAVHAEAPAAVVCGTCEQRWCTACSTVRHARGDFSVCPRCQGKGRLERFVALADAGDFAVSLGSVWKYPLAGRGWGVLLGGALVSSVVGWALALGGLIMPIPALAVALFLFSYFWRYMLLVVSATADGEDELPDWPDVRGPMEDTVLPLFRLVVASLLCLWPAVVVAVLGPPPFMVMVGVVLLGLALMPMHILVLALGGRVGDLSPLIVWPAIARAGWPYVVAIVALLLTVSARSWSGYLTSNLWFSGFLGGLVSTYFLGVQMRIIGLLYRGRGPALGLI